MTITIHKTISFIILIGIFYLVGGCDKADLYKKPTTVSFAFEVDTTGNAGADKLMMNDGYIVLSKFSVIGKREQAENFEFHRNFATGLQVSFTDLARLFELQYDLPQGNYEELIIRLETAGTNSTNLFFSGYYVYNTTLNDTAMVHLELDGARMFELNITNQLGNKDIVLNDKVEAQPQIIVTPKKLFIDVNQTTLYNAPLQNVHNKRTILVNKNNSDLTIYNSIEAALDKVFHCVLEN